MDYLRRISLGTRISFLVTTFDGQNKWRKRLKFTGINPWPLNERAEQGLINIVETKEHLGKR